MLGKKKELKIVLMGSDVLRAQCAPVTTFDAALREEVDAMFLAMEKADGVGLAGPQVNDPRRLFVVEVPGEGKRAFINPQIMETSMEETVMEEGCLSIPGVYDEVRRPVRVTVQAQDVDGRPFTVKADGLYARAIQHEYDHLNGILFIDHLDEEEQAKDIKAFERKNRFKRHK